jgi:hypothetical protein
VAGVLSDLSYSEIRRRVFATNPTEASEPLSRGRLNGLVARGLQQLTRAGQVTKTDHGYCLNYGALTFHELREALEDLERRLSRWPASYPSPFTDSRTRSQLVERVQAGKRAAEYALDRAHAVDELRRIQIGTASVTILALAQINDIKADQLLGLTHLVVDSILPIERSKQLKRDLKTHTMLPLMERLNRKWIIDQLLRGTPVGPQTDSC